MRESQIANGDHTGRELGAPRGRERRDISPRFVALWILGSGAGLVAATLPRPYPEISRELREIAFADLSTSPKGARTSFFFPATQLNSGTSMNPKRRVISEQL